MIKVPLIAKIINMKCYAVVEQMDDCVQISILSDDEYEGEAIASPTVPPRALEGRPTLSSKHHVLVKGYSENEGMPAILYDEDIITRPVAEHRTGFVTIGEHALNPDILERLKESR